MFRLHIRHRTTYLLMEGMRRVDEARGEDASSVPADSDPDVLLVF